MSGSAWRWVTSRIWPDERRQAAGDLVDPLEVGALLGRVELEVEQRLGVAADERQRRAQLVADRRDEPLAQLLEGADRADVADDRGRLRPPGRRAARPDPVRATAEYPPATRIEPPSAPRIAVS